jgi:hypothetical protein
MLLACSNKTTKLKTRDASLPPDNTISYFFDQKYEIIGVLSVQDFYGPPNYGDTPELDKIEKCYLITLDTPIDIKTTDTKNTHDLENKYNQSCFQIIGFNSYIDGKIVSYESNYLKKIPIGTRISVEGYFDSAISGHHHTDVTFVVEYNIPVIH